MKKTIMSALVSLLLVSPAGAKIGGGDITFTVQKAGDVVYSHDFHVGKIGLTCTECHYRIFSRAANSEKDKATMAGMESGKSCGVCHDGTKAFSVTQNCIRCHQNKYSGRK